ncbi:MAG: NAD(P)/FAD-dependent oxidoreductase [Carbonactinosporaceae bacterium]
MDAALSDAGYRRLSFWLENVPDRLDPRPRLAGDLDADVVIVGAGYTGLWAAYYLAEADPALRIAVLEREIAGFGASGRNGGWCGGLFPASIAKVARVGGRDAALALQRALYATVDEVARVTAAETIDCRYAKGGTVTLARAPAQLDRARAAATTARGWGLGEDDVRLLAAGEARALVGATRVLGGVYTPHCAAIDPARLVRGLARAVERRGVSVYERSPVRSLGPGVARTDRGTVRAAVVLRATEGYTAELPGQRLTVAPVYSLMLATERLPPAFWESAGLRRRETFSDLRHLIVYGQRTADDRLAFGGRGAPYHFGSRVRPAFDREPGVFAGLRRALVEMFPDLAAVEITHTWGGPLAVPRDWFASVGLDRRTGLGWGGGYVGRGVGTANLAGRTLADLVLERDTPLVRLPWVGHRSRRWEPEPLRWMGVNAGRRMAAAADRAEAVGRRDSRAARLSARLSGQ